MIDPESLIEGIDYVVKLNDQGKPFAVVYISDRGKQYQSEFMGRMLEMYKRLPAELLNQK